METNHWYDGRVEAQNVRARKLSPAVSSAADKKMAGIACRDGDDLKILITY